MSHKPEYWNKAKRSLSRRDPVMQAIIKQYPESQLISRGSPHYTLARSIAGQQISVKAAATIWGRVENSLSEITPHTILEADDATLRAAGLSARKVEYMRLLSQDFLGRLENYDWSSASDEEAIKILVSIKGIGRWTAEMFLIFHLMRPDVLPLDDIGLQKAVQKHYNNGEKLSGAEISAIAENWQPWRSVATWFLWRSLDPVEVLY